MADHAPGGPVELGANMDYSEHEKTYSGFLALAKYGTLFCVALLIAMAFFFFATSGGFVNGVFSIGVLAVIFAVGAFILR